MRYVALAVFAGLSACNGGGTTTAVGSAGTDGGASGAAGVSASGAAGTSGSGAAGVGGRGAAGVSASGAAGTSASGAAGVSASGAAGTGGSGTAGVGGRGGAGSVGTTAPFDLGRVNCLVQGDNKTTVALVNHCRAHVTFAGSQNQTGELDPDQFQCRDVGNATDNLPAIRYWGFTAPDPGLGRHTLAEFTFNTTFNNFDWYNISHVDAQNLPMQIATSGAPKCRTLTCADSLLAGCPPVGQYKGASGDVIACVSPEPNNPQSPVAQFFDKACPDAYSWSGDDAGSVVACAGEDYFIVFCP